MAAPPDGDIVGLLDGWPLVHWVATRAPSLATASEARTLAAIIGEVRPDVVHLHSSKAGLAGRLATRGRRPTIFQPHVWSFEAMRGVAARGAIAWERFALRWTSEVVCVSEGERATAVQAGLPPERLTVVPNGVDVDRFTSVTPERRAAARRELGLPAEPTVVVCIGRLVDVKGQRRLVAAWPAVRARVPGAQLVLVGDGPDRTALEREVGHDMRLVGPLSDVRQWLHAADLFVLPTRTEAMPLSVLEAMASGLPVVAGAVGGIPELLETGLIPPDDEDALVEAIASRLLDKAAAREEGARNRAHVESKYTLATRLEELTALTAAVAEGHRPT